ncbi:gluzincin family metallopeptidase [Anaeromyxobacter paludicola]|uniref:Peptidase M4 thermolysin n=1 Tax=Anaeromyxobacter paludicola TaxID=2918171 RepID=A0ABN6NAH3_9BACT|nr:hypothetical protein [Anaeromyxobacter paludicola]BDG09089.1 hypothetical protein AMPC_22020 [Anaeromyxobacter paludicola]
MIPAILLAALSAAPAGELPPAARVVRAPGGQVIHASGFVAAPVAGGPEAAARAFLSRHGEALGIGGEQALRLDRAGAAGSVAAVRFTRSVEGLPVFGGGVSVGVSPEGGVFLVNAAPLPPAQAGAFALGEAAAVEAALAALGPAARLRAPAVAERGWLPFFGALRAAWRVDLPVAPAASFRVYVDAASGRALHGLDRRRRVKGAVFADSPVASGAKDCPLASGVYAECQQPTQVDLPNLAGETLLSGSHTAVWNCLGGDAPAQRGGTAACQQLPADPKTGFVFAPDDAPTGTEPVHGSYTDRFAEVMAYWHVDRHVAFLKALDPAAPNALSFLPSFVNVTLGGQPYDNAYFDPTLGGMVFGQGIRDTTYDAEVVYHELTHGAVDAFGGLDEFYDALGVLADPGSVNEATADAMAAAETGSPEISRYLAGAFGAPYLRKLGGLRTCQGDGGPSDLGLGVDGLSGEVHADGQIWSDYFWELYQGLGGVPACGGKCNAAAQLQYKALELSAGARNGVTFGSYAASLVAAAQQLFPSRKDVGAYVECVAERHQLLDPAGAPGAARTSPCDARTVPLYQGEEKVAYLEPSVQGEPALAAFQATFAAQGEALVHACGSQGAAGTVYLRKGAPVQVDAGNPGDPSATAKVATFDLSAPIASDCARGADAVTLPAAGTWYALVAGTGGTATGSAADQGQVFVLTAASGLAARPKATVPRTCPPPAASSGGGCQSGPAGALSLLPVALWALRKRLAVRGPRSPRRRARA